VNLGSHAGFIVAAYAVAVAVVVCLILWVVIDYRAQRRALAELDAEMNNRAATRP
jgi:heme exporter protein D